MRLCDANIVMVDLFLSRVCQTPINVLSLNRATLLVSTTTGAVDVFLQAPTTLYHPEFQAYVKLSPLYLS
ncbi:hypothetical protein NQ317_005238 [Molorchus minor]|uniref:Uncharacterized protein n=1 Tax=Molorchus minor TaxID=1323400 RepID=A0ABQ9JPW2_9CUCU|nr:hypothetical protein NQ317_005238 [Molorchus minor]